MSQYVQNLKMQQANCLADNLNVLGAIQMVIIRFGNLFYDFTLYQQIMCPHSQRAASEHRLYIFVHF